MSPEARETKPRMSDLPVLKDRLRRCFLEGLPRFHLEDAGILAGSLSPRGRDFAPGEPSVRDTANVLVGLYLLRSRGEEVPLDPDGLLARCVSDYLDRIEAPEIALLLWADALGPRAHGGALWPALERRVGRIGSSTMQLSWTLSGVCEHFDAGGNRAAAEARARALSRAILGNQSARSGLFFASAEREGFLRRRRRPVALLASQVFAIQALARYSECFREAPAADAAARCAERLCALQGPRGQWWRAYRVREGAIAQEYPVYTVNQDGAVPAALTLLGRVRADRGLERAGDLGFLWVFGDNELGASMVDESRAVVLAGIRRDGDRFEPMHEMRSYHPGRCLYALALSAPG